MVFPQAIIRRVETGGKNGPVEKRIVLKKDDLFTLPEVGGMIVSQQGKLVVVAVASFADRAKEYQDVDLKQDDTVKMVEGKSVKTAGELNAAYEKTPIGAHFRMAIKRGDEMKLVSLTKGDPIKLPQMRRVAMKGGGENVMMLGLPIGLLVRNKGKDVVVDQVLPDASSDVKKAGIAGGDKIIGLNGSKVASMKQFAEAYDALKPGAPVNIEIAHGKRTSVIRFAKEAGGKKKRVIMND